MSNYQDLWIGSAVVGVGMPIMGKAHEIAMLTKDAHGTMWKWDGEIAKNCLKDNIKGTVTIGIIAAVVFAAASWASRVVAKEHEGKSTGYSQTSR